MTRSIIVINVDIRETRVALVEGGVIAELQIERASHRGTVGNIVLGKVTRVLPGMQAAFIDVGQERSAFLHVEDLIRPDDFELYLTGGADEQDESFRGTGEKKHVQARGEDDEDEDEDDEASDAHTEAALNGASPRSAADDSEDDASEPHHAALGQSEPALAKGPADYAEDEDDEDDDSPEDDASEDDASEDDSSEDEASDDEVSEDEADEDDVSEDDASEEDAEDDDVEDVEDVEDAEIDDDAEESGNGLRAGLGESDLAAGDSAASDLAASDSPRGEPEHGRAAEGGVPHDALPLAAGALAVTLDSALPLERAVPRARADAPGHERRRQRGGSAGRDAQGPGAAAPALEGRGRERNRAAQGAPAPEADSGRGRGARPLHNGRGGSARGRGGPGQRGRRGRRGNNNQAGNNNHAGNNTEPKAFGGRRALRGKAGGRALEGGAPPRVTRSVPITEVVKEGDEVVVQISKEPIGTKGARVTSHVSLPGRYVVYLPTVDHLGISKRIGSARERARLRQVMESLKPARGGLIVRTVAEGLTKKQLKADVGYLIRVWAEVCKRRENAKRAEELYTELDLVLKVARDLFTDEVKSIVIDDREQYARLVRFVEMFLPERVKDIELYTGSEPIFDAYGIEDEIGRALSRKVPLPSGGSLIVDQAEALTAIDVNTGRYVGKGSKDLEETALKTNLEAVEEIAYQLRFRNIGGLVILDLIDMEKHANRDKVWRALEAALLKDKAKTTLNRISELGLIEMTRKRTRESLGRMLHEPCFYCDGTGQIQSKSTIAYEILRQIGRERHSLPGYSVVVNAHPAIVDFLKTEDRGALEEAERRYARRIELAQRTEYHIEQYDLQGK
jgi:ribonuclease G